MLISLEIEFLIIYVKRNVMLASTKKAWQALICDMDMHKQDLIMRIYTTNTTIQNLFFVNNFIRLLMFVLSNLWGFPTQWQQIQYFNILLFSEDAEKFILHKILHFSPRVVKLQLTSKWNVWYSIYIGLGGKLWPQTR